MLKALRDHWPEYVMEAAELALFLMVASALSTLFGYPSSPLHQAISNPDLRRVVMGLLMGLTSIGLVYSPWGKQSGAHMNPAVTLTFYRLGKVKPWDAAFYIVFQFLGSLAGIGLAALVLQQLFTAPPIQYIVTVPGPLGWLPALVVEGVTAFVMMMVVLVTSNQTHLNRFTGLFAGGLVMLFIIFAAPVSGFGMNPARSFASALPAHVWTAFWLYVVMPPLGMVAAAEVYRRLQGVSAIKCAKLHHDNDKRCIFCCGYRQELSDILPIPSQKIMHPKP
jgi:aquaporin Z